MAPTIDISNWYNQETFSDVTLVFSGQEIKCRRIILSNASDYFKTLLKPDGAFAESKQKAIELKEDPPAAVQAMIRYIYSFDYNDIEKLETVWHRVEYHVNVYKVAHKYLVAPLQEKAFENLSAMLPCLYPNGRGPLKDVFGTVKLLADQRHYDNRFGTMMVTMVNKHLAVLIDSKDFRAWLETEGGSLLGIMLAAVKRGAPVADSIPAPATTNMFGGFGKAARGGFGR